MIMKSIIPILILITMLGCQDDPNLECCSFPDVQVQMINLGPIEVDGCGWQLHTPEMEFYGVDIPEELKVDSLYIFTPLELLADSFTCFGGSKFRHARLANSSTDIIKMYYAETQCSDPWQSTRENDFQVLSAMAYYLSEHNVDIYGAEIWPEPGGMGYCEACICPSGRTIVICLPAAFADRAEALNFYQNNCEDDPLENIAWLKELKTTFDQRAGAAGSQIIQYTYEGECVYLIDDCYQCPDALNLVFDKDKNLLCEFGGIDGRDTCPGFLDNATNKIVLYSNINH